MSYSFHEIEEKGKQKRRDISGGTDGELKGIIAEVR